MDHKHIFLVRHGSRVLDPLKSEREHKIKDRLTSDSTQDGPDSCCAFSFSATAELETRKEVTKVAGTGTVGATRSAERTRTEIIAGALADQLQSMGGKQITRIVFSPHTAAEQTAEVFRHVLGTRGHLAPNCGFEPDERLDPIVPAEDRKAYTTLLGGSGWLIVGHQPKLTTLAEWLLDGHLPAKTLPLAGSEVACIRLGDNPRLLWLLTDKSKELKADLREKIKSKFDVAKFFIGALIINTSVLLSNTIAAVWAPKMSAAIAILMIVGSTALMLSLGFAVSTLLAFDRLTMPSEFWSEEHKVFRSETGFESPQPSRWGVLRPPSEATVVLLYEMIHTWKSLFEPALFTAVVSIMSFLLAIAASKIPALTNAITAVIALGLLAGGGILFYYYSRMKPKLGFED